MYKKLRHQGLPFFREYASWMQGAYALFNSFETPLAAELYHLLASLSPQYSFLETNKKLGPILLSISQNGHRPIKKLGFGSLVHLFKKAISGSDIRLRDLYTANQGIRDFRDPYRKELSFFCPGSAQKVKTRRAKIIRYIHRRAGMDPLPPALSNIDTLASFFEISPSVISNDLSCLQASGLIKLSFVEENSLNRSRQISLTAACLDILCKASMPPPSALEKETRIPDSKPSSPTSDFSPLYINIPFQECPLDTEQSEELPPSSSSLKKINKKEEISAPKAIPPDLRPLIRKSFERFCLLLKKMPGKNRVGKATTKLFAQIGLKYPERISSIAEQIVNKPPAKTPYFWLKDECFSLDTHSPFLNFALGKADLELFARMKIPPAECIVFIRRTSISFPLISLQGARKHPLSLPNGIVYCTAINGPLFVNRDGRKWRLEVGE